MRKDIHPKEYRTVVFKDMSNETAFVSKSTIKTKDTIVWEDGNEYPLVKVHISSASHPFFTGEEKIIDTEGRVDRFKAKFAAAEARKSALATKPKKLKPRKLKKPSSNLSQIKEVIILDSLFFVTINKEGLYVGNNNR